MTGPGEDARWVYDAGYPTSARKHAPIGPGPSVRIERRSGRPQVVTTCPRGISLEEAREVVWSKSLDPVTGRPARESGQPPSRMVLVHMGVAYEVRATVPGAAYHAFPMLPEDWERLPRRVTASLDVGSESDQAALAEHLRTLKTRISELKR